MAEMREGLQNCSLRKGRLIPQHAINPLPKLVDKPVPLNGMAKEREEIVIDLFFDLLENYF